VIGGPHWARSAHDCLAQRAEHLLIEPAHAYSARGIWPPPIDRKPCRALLYSARLISAPPAAQEIIYEHSSMLAEKFKPTGMRTPPNLTDAGQQLF
jgi:hypothetical protein